jgi:DNA helicase II / ATP-dependent DNA helicase PcrA
VNAIEYAISQLKDNTEQWEAFNSSSNCVVLAPPGSGKTKLLTTRVASDVLTSVAPPRGIASITLTNPAADELRRRLHRLGMATNRVNFIGTVHSFSLSRVIRPFAAAAGMQDAARRAIADDASRDEAFKRALGSIYQPWEDTRYLRPTFERLRGNLALQLNHTSVQPRQRLLLERYEEALHDCGLMDFDEAVAVAVELVENHQFVRQVLIARYPLVFVDEYQDLSPGLDRLVRALCFGRSEESARLFAVGDPDQAIFGFTGSRPELLDELAATAGVMAVRLKINYRSADEIIRRSQMILPNSREVRGIREGGEVVSIRCRDFAEQARTAGEISLALHHAGCPLHEIAILCPGNEQCSIVTAVLLEQGIPCYTRQTEYRSTALTSLIETLAAWLCFDRESSGFRLGDIIRNLRGLVGPDWHRRDDVRLIDVVLSFGGREHVPAADFVDAAGSSVAQELLRRGRLDEHSSFVALSDATRQGSLSAWTIEDLGMRAMRVDRVEVATMTSSKGLEFDHVFILGADEGRIPFFTADRDPIEMAEEIRKLYVSLTRARHSVRILYSGFVEWKTGKVTNKGPSRFLRKMRLA